MAGKAPLGPIPQTDPRAGYLAHQAAIDRALSRVLESGSYILGREVEAFEAAFADFVGVAYAVGCASGTDAIELALRACNIGAGDLVFTVSHTAVATVAAIERVGAMPVLIDVEPGTYTMAPHELSRALQVPHAGRRAAVLPVHLYGQPAELSPLCDLASANGLRLIEDCAQSHGALCRGRSTGSFGDVGCFSFYPTKNLGALGDGGMVVARNPALAAAYHCRPLRFRPGETAANASEAPFVRDPCLSPICDPPRRSRRVARLVASYGDPYRHPLSGSGPFAACVSRPSRCRPVRPRRNRACVTTALDPHSPDDKPILSALATIPG